MAKEITPHPEVQRRGRAIALAHSLAHQLAELNLSPGVTLDYLERMIANWDLGQADLETMVEIRSEFQGSFATINLFLNRGLGPQEIFSLYEAREGFATAAGGQIRFIKNGISLETIADLSETFPQLDLNDPCLVPDKLLEAYWQIAGELPPYYLSASQVFKMVLATQQEFGPISFDQAIDLILLEQRYRDHQGNQVEEEDSDE